MSTRAARHFLFPISLLTATILGAPVLGAGLTLHVSPNGSDGNTCGQTQPCREIRRALELVGPGDTIQVADGTYKGFDVEDLHGNAAAPITIKAQGANAVIQKTTDRPDNRDTIFITYSSYIVVDGLRSFNANRAALRVDQSPNVTVRNCVFGDNAKWGIFTDFSDDLRIENNETYGSVGEHGIYVSNSGDRPIVRGNRSHDNAGAGLHVNGDASAGGDGIISGALIEDNVIYDNGRSGGAGINMDGVQDSTIRNNLVYNNHATGISLYQIDGGQGPKGNNVYHNTVYQASDGRWALLIWTSGGTNTVRNNVLYHPGGKGGINYESNSDVNNTNSDYNVMTHVTPNDGGTVFTLAQWQAQGRETHSFSASLSSLFVNAAGGNFHLAPGSPAIDRGQTLAAVTNDIEGNPRPRGATSDIGAYEAGAGEPAPVLEAVVWTSASGVSVSGSSLIKTAPTGWNNAGAVSTKSLAAGDGFVEFTVTETNTRRTLGLSNGNSNLNWNDLDFGLYLTAKGRIRVYEKGVSRGTFGIYARGDRMRVAVVSGSVKYSRNGTVFYTSPAAPTYPLLVDTSLYTKGATLTTVVISGTLR